MPIPYLYPYDPLGTASTNHISNELHNVSPPPDDNDASFIVPRAAPFFTQGLVIRTGANVTDPVLTLGTDYIFTHPFIEATNFLNKLVYGSILFLDREYTGDVYLTYQTIGGSYTLDDYDIVEELTRKLYNIRMVSWTQISGLPLNFPPLPHQTNAADMIGMSEVVLKLGEILLSLQASGVNLNSLMVSFAQHLNGLNSHTKAQVGLHLVPNHAKATQADLEAQSDSTLMTPYQTLKMISLYGGGSGTGNSLSDDNKVDKTTTVTGEGLASGGGTLDQNRTIVVNRPTPLELFNGVANDKALTPLSGVHLINFWRNMSYPPVDNALTQIDDINAVTHPGLYYLDHDYLNLAANNGKVPIVVKTNSLFGAKLNVTLLTRRTDNVDVIEQHLIGYDALWATQSDYYRSSDDGGATWAPWYSTHSHNKVIARCIVTVSNAVCQFNGGDNVLSITKEPDGFIGNYYNTSPLDNVYTVTFSEPHGSESYTLAGNIAGPDTNAQYSLVIVDKHPDRFSFIAVGLNNYSNGSDTFHSTQFKADIVITGVVNVANLS